VSLAWDAVSAATLSGYRLYYGQASQTYTASIDVGLTTSYTVTGLTDGQTYYFAVTAYDTAGDQSGFSNEVSTTLSSLTGLVAAYNFNKDIVTAIWGGITNPTTTDWIGLYASGAADTAFIDWIYVSCSQTPGSAQASGSCSFVVPATINNHPQSGWFEDAPLKGGAVMVCPRRGRCCRKPSQRALL
jgi:hypothetical protein